MEGSYWQGKRENRPGFAPPFSRLQNDRRPTLGLPDPVRVPHRRERGVWGFPIGFTSFDSNFG
jgi:hypothetical protein